MYTLHDAYLGRTPTTPLKNTMVIFYINESFQPTPQLQKPWTTIHFVPVIQVQ